MPGEQVMLLLRDLEEAPSYSDYVRRQTAGRFDAAPAKRFWLVLTPCQGPEELGRGPEATGGRGPGALQLRLRLGLGPHKGPAQGRLREGQGAIASDQAVSVPDSQSRGRESSSVGRRPGLIECNPG